MSRRGLYTIAPHAPFLPLLVDRVLDGTLLNGWDSGGPFGLSDITIILPTRRARLTLAALFAERRGGATLLPDIRTFGGDAAEEELFLPPVDAPAPPVAAGRLERRLILSNLVAQFARSADGFAAPPNAAEIFRLADSLGEVIDDLTIEDVPASRLRQLVPADYAANWQQIVQFLEIVLSAWPDILAARGKVDEAAARNTRLLRQAATAPALYGEQPVIAAGSTGSIPATAALLKAIAALPRGVVVLPGLDTSLTPQQHEMLVDGETSQGHPQYGLGKLLRRLGAGIADVEELAGTSARADVMRAALARSEETAQWARLRDETDVEAALAGVAVLAAPSADLEARAVALAARDAVAHKRSVGIVTRDQTLARRIAAELRRHGIVVDDPAGTPLYQSGAGRLARQVLTLAVNRFAAVDTIALLRNSAVTLGRPRGEVRREANRLDLKLRRERVKPGLFGLLEIAVDHAMRGLIEALGEAMTSVTALCEAPTIDARQLATGLIETIDNLTRGSTPTPPPPLKGEGGARTDVSGMAELRLWAGKLAEVDDRGAPFAPRTLDTVLAALMVGEKVQPGARRRDDVFIWGELEARLQNPDLLILAGVNEDIWPAPADAGPWMSRGMRMGLGLEPPERQQGQAAHDFELAMGNRQVLVAFAERIGTSPALPSRFVQRLDAFVGDDAAKLLRARGTVWLAQATAIDAAGLPRPARRPEPVPPAKLRPKRLSVTEIETLVRSPYDIYAKHVLQLRKLEPLGSEPSARERGTMIHKVFEQFVLTGHNFGAPDAAARMMELAREAFKNLDSVGERRDIWLSRFARAAEQFLTWELERQGGIAARAAEIKGEWVFPALGGFTLSGKADRVDRRTDGLLEILDFKTGGVPLPAEMRNFEAPQLLLEAAMARAGVLPEVPAHDAAALTYIKIGLGPQAFRPMPFRVRGEMSLMQAVDEIELRTQRHIEAFLVRDGLAMAARIRPRDTTGRKPRPGDYDHLARTDEWTLTAGVDDQ